MSFFDNYKPGFNPYKLNVYAAYEYKTMWVVVRDGEILEEHNAGIVNLASTSKPFTMDLLSRFIKERDPSTSLGMNQIEDKFIATKDLVKELIFRKQNKHIEQNTSYKDVLIWLSKNKISNPKSKLRAKIVGNDAGLYNWKAKDFPVVTINFEELSFNALTLSSNSAIEIARNKLDEILGGKVQEELEKQHIAPTLQLHQGGFKLLNQSRANSGNLKDIVLAFNKLTKSADHRILKSIQNNKIFFDVGVSTFIKGADIWEKTGVAWPLNYGSELEKLGFPPHMVMGTLFSIKDNQHLTTFGIFKVIAIAVPKEKDANGFPDIYEKNYTTYVNLVKYKFLNKYREELSKLVNRNSIVKVSIPKRFNDYLKKSAMKLKMLM